MSWADKVDFNQHVEANALKVLDTTVNISKLVSFLQSNKHIVKLSLKYVRIDDEDAKELAKLTHLAALDLSMNRIGYKRNRGFS
ncbi:hypothetical protein EJB10_03260 [Wolbachia endosymbiont of Brugia malayi]|nr:hypothetical protein EJB10_03260 [Wolbachia endosymbiont of Brugia malayi]